MASENNNSDINDVAGGQDMLAAGQVRQREVNGGRAGAALVPTLTTPFRSRVAASVVIQFVSGHKGSDVLRELVQNEYDAGGRSLAVRFGEDALRVSGDGRGVEASGWKRLEVILGTGPTVGDDAGERVDAKEDGIGVKNLGLRSLFLFGDDIFVRSKGQVAQLNLPNCGTRREKDPDWWGGPGIRLIVPYRERRFETLPVFTIDEERRIFDAMAGGMFATLSKLAMDGTNPGIVNMALSSDRLGLAIDWRQTAVSTECRVKAIDAVRRTGRLKQKSADGSADLKRKFEEIEYSRTIKIPMEFRDRVVQPYYRVSGGATRIAVSLPIARGKIDFTRPGNFYYPLQAPAALTGSPISISGPFEMNADRSNILDIAWNRWLTEQAIALTKDLVNAEWFLEFGADAYQAFLFEPSSVDSRFTTGITTYLAKDACWPTRSTLTDGSYSKASDLVFLEDPRLDGFLWGRNYLHDAFYKNDAARVLAMRVGVKKFTLQSLVKIRCTRARDSVLETKIPDGEANFIYTDAATELSKLARQKQAAIALAAFSKKLLPGNQNDLKSTPTTLTAKGELRPAKDLIVVPEEIWDICPEPMANRLHRHLVLETGITMFCRQFDEETWIVDACERAKAGTIEKKERDVLFDRILALGASIDKQTLAAVRTSPVVKDHRGEWAAPEKMAILKGPVWRFMSSVVSAPGKALLANAELVSRLKIRDDLNGDDLIAGAYTIKDRPEKAKDFEDILNENAKLITSAVAEKLVGIPFLLNLAGAICDPTDLLLNTKENRLCLNDNLKIVQGKNDPLYRRLGVAERPSLNQLLVILLDNRDNGHPVPNKEAFYTALAAAVDQEPERRSWISETRILLVDGGYHFPGDVVVASQIPAVFDGAVPVLREASDLGAAFLRLGAARRPGETHWIKVFEMLSSRFVGEPVAGKDRRLFEDVYRSRGTDGLPEDLGQNVLCLLTDDGYLFSLGALKAGRVLENDFPRVGDVLQKSGVPIGLITPTSRSDSFYESLGLLRLSGYVEAGAFSFGAGVEAPRWFRTGHIEELVRTLRRPVFAEALHELARRIVTTDGTKRPSQADIRRRLSRVEKIDFVDEISREYGVQGISLELSVEVAIQEEIIGLVKPRNRIDFQYLVATALAELAGATDEADLRELANAISQLLQCANEREMLVYLDRQGIRLREEELDFIDTDEGEEPANSVDETVIVDALHGAVHNIMEVAQVAARSDNGDQSDRRSHERTSSAPARSVILPNIANVVVTELPLAGRAVGVRIAGGSPSSGSRGVSSPRTAAEVTRDKDIGDRGEELVYRQELERVRKLGYEKPEKIVIWTSRNDPFADHDIRSISDDGRPRWIEVKSTTGRDGSFEWSANEFGKAMQEKENYELCRVYLAASEHPIAKRFLNPAAMIGTPAMDFELASLRVSIEKLNPD